MIVKLTPDEVYPAVVAQFPYKVRPVIPDDIHWNAPLDWCVEQWGGAALMEYPRSPREYPKTWVILASSTWTRVAGDYYFQDPDQAFAFKMRWG